MFDGPSSFFMFGEMKSLWRKRIVEKVVSINPYQTKPERELNLMEGGDIVFINIDELKEHEEIRPEFTRFEKN